VPDLASAATALPTGARVFLATGHGSVPHFRPIAGASVILRVIDPADGGNFPRPWTILAARPPFSVDSEVTTFRKHGITHLVARNSGGAEGRAKLEAAAALGLGVVMVARPDPPAGAGVVASVAEALAWLDDAARAAGSRLDTPRDD
jgi:precorrin-6A/cobalt-precorrin-6A reductase